MWKEQDGYIQEIVYSSKGKGEIKIVMQVFSMGEEESGDVNRMRGLIQEVELVWGEGDDYCFVLWSLKYAESIWGRFVILYMNIVFGREDQVEIIELVIVNIVKYKRIRYC